MFTTAHTTPLFAGRGRARAARALETWREAASVVATRWQNCLEAERGSLPIGLAGRRVACEPVEEMSVIGHLLRSMRPFARPEKRSPHAAASGWLAGRHEWGPCRSASTGAATDDGLPGSEAQF